VKLVPKSWTSFQHYKNRKPPWIKLHRTLLDDRQFQRLPLSSRALAPMLWLLAAESVDGVFDANVEELAFRLRTPGDEIQAGLGPLLDAGFFVLQAHEAGATLAVCDQVASTVLASRLQPDSAMRSDRKQLASPETETETETEKKKPGGFVGKADVPRCRVQEVIDTYHKVLPELPSVKLLTDKRKKAIAKFWRWVLTSTKEGGARRAATADEALEWFHRYFERVRDNDFLMARVGRTGSHASWECSLDYLLTEKGMCQVLEKTGGPT
jgi:hypothetical protein